MITVSDVSLSYGTDKLFDKTNLIFTPGTCYRIIGANAAGKSTCLKILSGALEPSPGELVVAQGTRLSVLEKVQNIYHSYLVLASVFMGHARFF